MKLTNCFISIIAGCSLPSVCLAEPIKAIGWIEHVNLHSKDMLMNAKIDTGADNSSIHATNINIYAKDNIKMVRFTVQNKEGKSAIFNKPLVRLTNIKRKGAGAEPIERPVVNMDLCIGNTLKTAHVNLANRGNFKYRMLIGRSFLKDRFLVNSNAKYTAKPECQGKTIAQKNPA
jgi:hypothetical protein